MGCSQSRPLPGSSPPALRIQVDTSLSSMDAQDGDSPSGIARHLTATSPHSGMDIFEVTFNTSPTGLIIVNMDEGGTIIRCNNLASQMFQYSVGELVGCSIERLVPGV